MSEAPRQVLRGCTCFFSVSREESFRLDLLTHGVSPCTFSCLSNFLEKSRVRTCIAVAPRSRHSDRLSRAMVVVPPSKESHVADPVQGLACQKMHRGCDDDGMQFPRLCQVCSRNWDVGKR